MPLKSPLLCLILIASFTTSTAQSNCVDFKATETETDLQGRITFIKAIDGECADCGDGFRVNSYDWTFEGAKPVSKSGPGPHNIKYVEVGKFTVKLTVSYFGPDPSEKACIKSEIKVQYITVKPSKPVELESFEANVMSDNVKLYWTVIYETNNDHYLLEKSKDNKNFKPVVEVTSGNLSSKTIYSAEDKSPTKGRTYYRLSYVDKAGVTTELSDLTVKWFDLKESLSMGKDVLVIVESEEGEELYSKIIITNSTEDEIFAVDPSERLSPGNYVIIGSSMNEIFDKMLVVEEAE